MNKTIGWIVLGAALLLVLWVMGADHSRSMEQCEKSHSKDTCWVSLNP